MDRAFPAAIILVVTALVIAAMWWAWRGRVRRSAALRGSEPTSVATEQRLAVDGLYVATTERDKPLERLAIAGLAFRGKAVIAAHEDALVVMVRGEEPVVMPAGSIRRVGVATWAIDRVVERDGLLFVTWAAGSRDTDSYFRILDLAARERLIAEVERMIAASDAASREVED